MTEPVDDLRRYADDLASEVSPFAAERAVRRALAVAPRRPRRALVALATTGLLGISNVALATVADSAVPGDRLYGIDRAYERVVDLAGLGGPRVSERLLETGVLVERGRLADALALVQETLGKVLDSDDPASAMDALVTGAADSPAAVNELVLSELLATARSVGAGDLDGQDVAALARELGRTLADARSQGNSGQGNSGQGNSGQGDPGQGNPGQGDPGQGNQGQGNPGQGNLGQGNPGQGSSGQGNQGQNQGQGSPNPNAGASQP